MTVVMRLDVLTAGIAAANVSLHNYCHTDLSRRSLYLCSKASAARSHFVSQDIMNGGGYTQDVLHKTKTFYSSDFLRVRKNREVNSQYTR